MKKYLVVFLMSVTMLSGCSYLSKLNPWNESKEEQKKQEEIAVNKYLWQAALEKVNFMPLQETSVQSGTIITSWTGIEGYPNQKFKLEIRVVSKELSSNCLQIKGFSRTKIADGGWAEEPMNPTMVSAIEQSILERSRVLYRRSLAH